MVVEEPNHWGDGASIYVTTGICSDRKLEDFGVDVGDDEAGGDAES
jgi:hypothetical protein